MTSMTSMTSMTFSGHGFSMTVVYTEHAREHDRCVLSLFPGTHRALRPLDVAQGLQGYVAIQYDTTCVVSGCIESDGRLYGGEEISIPSILRHIAPGAPVLIPNNHEWTHKLADWAIDGSPLGIISAEGVTTRKDGAARVATYVIPQTALRDMRD